jgi:hypothetical protein
MQTPKLSNLIVTDHAMLRAKERLGLDSIAFLAWVSATSQGWELQNASYFEAQNLKVGRAAFLYRCPFTVTDSVCVAVSQDHAIKTVMRYEDIDHNRLRERLEKSERALSALKGQFEQERKTIAEVRTIALSMGVAPGVRVPWTVRAIIRVLLRNWDDIAHKMLRHRNDPGMDRVAWAFCIERLRLGNLNDALDQTETLEKADRYLAKLGIPLTEYTEA